MGNTNAGEKMTVPPTVEQPDTTKIISERLAAMRSKDRNELAKAMGFDSWDSAMNSGMDKKLLDAGIDPEMGKPIINDIVENHPEVKRARELLAEAEETRRVAGLEVINARFGTAFTSLDELDDATKGLINKGLPVEQAYGAIHYADGIAIQKPDASQNAKLEREASLKHLGVIPGAGIRKTADVVLSADDIASVKRFMPNATEEQIKQFKSKHQI